MKKLVYVNVLLFNLIAFQCDAKQSVYPATSLTGGGAGALDAIAGQTLAEGDTAIATTPSGTYTYYLDSTCHLKDNSPRVISPATNGGTKRWVLVRDSSSYYVNPCAADQGVDGNDYSIYDIAVTIGTSKKATITLPHSGSENITPYTVATALDLSSYSNINFHFENGAQLVTSSGVTLYSTSNIIAQPSQHIVSGTGLFFYGGGGTVHPEWFGAKPDNVTNSTPALQAAVDSLKAGGKLDLGIGTYRITSVVIRNPGTVVAGKGWASVIATTLSATTNTVPVLWVKANQSTLRDFKVTWVTFPMALVAANPINQNSSISVGWSEVTGTQPLIENTLIENLYAYGGKCHGIALGRSHNTTIRNCRVETVYGTGLWTYYACQLRIVNNYFRDTKDESIGVQANGPDAYGPDDYSMSVVIDGNVIEDSCANGIGIRGVYGGVVSNNVIDNTWIGGIIAKRDAPGGHVSPSSLSITGNIIRRPFQNYGPRKYRARDVVSTVGGVHGVIEAWARDETVIANNIIQDTGRLHAGYRGIFAGSKHLTITGNNLKLAAQVGLSIGSYGDAAAYGAVEHLNIMGNTIVISSGHGSIMLLLNGVSEGLVSGNMFDCGGQTLKTPAGRFVTSLWSKNVLITGNRVLNYTDKYSDSGNSSNIVLLNNHGL